MNNLVEETRVFCGKLLFWDTGSLQHGEYGSREVRIKLGSQSKF